MLPTRIRVRMLERRSSLTAGYCYNLPVDLAESLVRAGAAEYVSGPSANKQTAPSQRKNAMQRVLDGLKEPKEHPTPKWMGVSPWHPQSAGTSAGPPPEAVQPPVTDELMNRRRKKREAQASE